jgi:tRNA pseudouridine55 synthase
MPPPLDGLLLVNKPGGPTSHDIVGRVRRALGQRRVGHAGTLDPMALGLLPLLLGRATRLMRFLPHSPKTYSGTLQLGRTTDTDDVTGAVLTEYDGALPSPSEVLEAARRLLGRSMQVPPAYSARKIEGRRMYELARNGTAVVAKPTEIDVLRFDLSATGERGRFGFVAEVSGGTYIRGLARDLGAMLDCGGCLASLQRTRIGPLDLAGAVNLRDDDPIERDRLVAAALPLEQIPLSAVTLTLEDDAAAGRFSQGAFVETADGPDPGSPIRVLGPSGALLGMAEVRDGRLRPSVVLG